MVSELDNNVSVRQIMSIRGIKNASILLSCVFEVHSFHQDPNCLWSMDFSSPQLAIFQEYGPLKISKFYNCQQGILSSILS